VHRTTWTEHRHAGRGYEAFAANPDEATVEGDRASPSPSAIDCGADDAAALDRRSVGDGRSLALRSGPTGGGAALGASQDEGHGGEQHGSDLGARLNWLRAGVLGANDGIVSVAGIVIGVAGATSNLTAIVTAGVAGLVAGAMSMAGGEYVSVSTQRDTEKAVLDKERWELANLPEEELAELTGLYRAKGLSPELAADIARELTAIDALRAHAEVELGIDPDDLTSPWAAAGASFLAFTVGAAVPLLTMLAPTGSLRIWVTVLSVVVGLVVTGAVSANLGGARRGRAVARNVGMGVATMAFTYLVGLAFGTATA
jgi:VIT1/CCC1 family predicted Fe2+/Mn2+ transporter